MLAEAQGWDYVVLQDQSQTPGGGMDGDSGAGVGVAKARSIAALRAFYAPAISAARATPVLYSTWGRHGGDPYNAECCGYGTFKGMTQKTTEGYEAYAAALKEAAPEQAAPLYCRPPLIVPAGRAFELVHLVTLTMVVSKGTNHGRASHLLWLYLLWLTLTGARGLRRPSRPWLALHAPLPPSPGC